MPFGDGNTVTSEGLLSEHLTCISRRAKKIMKFSFVIHSALFFLKGAAAFYVGLNVCKVPEGVFNYENSLGYLECLIDYQSDETIRFVCGNRGTVTYHGDINTFEIDKSFAMIPINGILGATQAYPGQYWAIPS
ncbi:protein of unknown function [Taphrina deformans PYCC 5710]|uniref:Cyanovirin-N domain-containing protein n=1 Tax=Taphrina deformans (strain PYCC 5710 / ATCC 11124 / CBS 356.35 / IMI 108563 / JCM 9778 / NBRC 8474) TaxID=1097556 RepID=R4XLD2_TAPDE|nr:protein of unknown function [Taphrina deformans PYCC 5710]|eukprot:CCG84115.1 protein of unknown function [Taphrina deformans PYCC 5710]